MPKLESSNEIAFRQSIPFQALPKTFQHAIELTRQLEVRYPWIDALCIIQDSDDDWLSEGATMANVYRNAYCNIAATSATDINRSLFYARNIRGDSPEPNIKLVHYRVWRAAGQL